MKAFIQTGYGSPDVIVEREIAVPQAGPGEVLVRVRAASLSAGDRFLMRGTPFPARLAVGFPRPKADHVVGLDFSGVVESVGEGVTRYAAGDPVFGECRGACAEFARANVTRIAHKPDALTFEQAAALPTSGCTALQALRDHASVQPGYRVLINGATGGVGTFAVQIAKALGAEVTGVCGTSNLDLVRSLGADHVIDYTREDFTEMGPRFDVVLDNVASHPLSRARRALVPTGIHVPSSGHGGMRWIIAAALTAPFVKTQGAPLVAKTTAADLTVLAEMVTQGRVAPVIDEVYPLARALDAFVRLDAGHQRGKIVLSAGDE